MSVRSIARRTVKAENLAPGAVTFSKIARKAVRSRNLATGSVTTSKIVGGAVNLAKMDISSVDTRYVRKAEGSYTGDGTLERPINLGFRPIQVSITATNALESYLAFSENHSLKLAETASVSFQVRLTPAGFIVADSESGGRESLDGNNSGTTYVYIALG